MCLCLLYRKPEHKVMDYVHNWEFTLRSEKHLYLYRFAVVYYKYTSTSFSHSHLGYNEIQDDQQYQLLKAIPDVNEVDNWVMDRFKSLKSIFFWNTLQVPGIIPIFWPPYPPWLAIAGQQGKMYFFSSCHSLGILCKARKLQTEQTQGATKLADISGTNAVAFFQLLIT